MAVEVMIDCQGDLRCQALHGPSQVTIQTDAPKDNGGQGRAFSPTDLVAAALGSCVGTTMDIVGKRHGIAIAGTRVKVIKEMVADPQRRIGRLITDVYFPAAITALSQESKDILENAARFCPVKMTISRETELIFTFHYA